MKLSIVIPAFGNQTDIDETLVSVLENRPSDCEILLTHSESYVDPYQLDDEIRLVEAPHPCRLSMLNQGFAAANGRIVHTICPGISVTEGWCEAALESFAEDANLGSLAPSIFTGRSKSPVRGVEYCVGNGKKLVRKQRMRVLGPTLNSGFYLRSALNFMHGFDPQFSELADIELGIRMHSANYRSVSSPDVQLHSDSNLVLRQMHGFKAGQARGRLFQKAKDFGLVSSQGLAVLTEPLRNGFGLAMVTGTIGRLACGSADTNRAKTLPMDQSVSDSSKRHAA